MLMAVTLLVVVAAAAADHQTALQLKGDQIQDNLAEEMVAVAQATMDQALVGVEVGVAVVLGLRSLSTVI